jgi:undecaprenyl-diphosphatase
MTDSKHIQSHSFHIALLLLITITLGSIGVGIFVQQNPLVHIFDDFFYETILFGPHNKLLDILVWPINYNFIPIGPMPSYFYLWIGLILIYIAIFKRSLFSWALLTVVVATILALIIADLDWHFVFRQRPFVTLPNNIPDFWKHVWSVYSSYPSGHARETAMYATITSYYIPKLKWVMIGLVLFVGWSRIYVGAHYPSDVIAGIIIGALTAKVALIIIGEVQSMFEKKKGARHLHGPN